MDYNTTSGSRPVSSLLRQDMVSKQHDVGGSRPTVSAIRTYPDFNIPIVGGMTVFFGSGGAGKSLLLRELVEHVAPHRSVCYLIASEADPRSVGPSEVIIGAIDFLLKCCKRNRISLRHLTAITLVRREIDVLRTVFRMIDDVTSDDEDQKTAKRSALTDAFLDEERKRFQNEHLHDVASYYGAELLDDENGKTLIFSFKDGYGDDVKFSDVASDDTLFNRTIMSVKELYSYKTVNATLESIVPSATGSALSMFLDVCNALLQSDVWIIDSLKDLLYAGGNLGAGGLSMSTGELLSSLGAQLHREGKHLITSINPSTLHNLEGISEFLISSASNALWLEEVSVVDGDGAKRIETAKFGPCSWRVWTGDTMRRVISHGFTCEPRAIGGFAAGLINSEETGVSSTSDAVDSAIRFADSTSDISDIVTALHSLAVERQHIING